MNYQKERLCSNHQKKHEMKKIFHERTVNKASSLPKLKLYNVIESKEPVEVPEK